MERAASGIDEAMIEVPAGRITVRGRVGSLPRAGYRMGAAIELRGDFDGGALRRLAKRSRDGGQSRRFVALAEICDGERRSDRGR